MPTVFHLLAGCADPGGGASHSSDGPYVSIPEQQLLRSVPVFGGTLESAPAIDGFVSADPEGNQVVRIVGDTVTALDLGENARPFRIHVEDATAWVTLRGSGELVEVDLGAMTETWRTRVCGEPRGVDRSPEGPLVVACADGPIAEVDDTNGGELLRSKFVAPDLRDIVAVGDQLYVSRFTSATVLVVDPRVLITVEEHVLHLDARVAWRMRKDPLVENGVAVLHQLTRPVVLVLDPTPPGGTYYPTAPPPGGGCGRLHETVVTRDTELGPPDTSHGLDQVRLATDFAFGPARSVSFVSTGAEPGSPGVVEYLNGLTTLWGGTSGCITGEGIDVPLSGRPSAVAYDEQGALYIQTASPFGIVRADVDTTTVTATRGDPTLTAPQFFHTAADASGVACASCHPEGLEDGNVWTFAKPDGTVMLRRTMPLAGMLLSREPYHWNGDLADADALLADTYLIRMGGGTYDPDLPTALFEWLDDLRPVRALPLVPPEEVAEGEEAFVRAGCADCHLGDAFTNNEITYGPLRVGSDPVKTPSLIGVGSRSPLLHDGCAETIEERFLPPCDDGLDRHGRISLMSTSELNALIGYLRSL